jgi:hypothetical protein
LEAANVLIFRVKESKSCHVRKQHFTRYGVRGFVLIHFTMQKFTLFLLLVLYMAGCKRNSLPYGDDVIVNVKPEFSIDLFEQRDDTNGTPVFGLWVESMEVFECDNYQIIHDKTQDAAAIKVMLQGIQKPQNCNPQTAKAKVFIPIGKLADGAYSLEIDLRDVVSNKGKLKVSQGNYSLEMPDPKGIVIGNYLVQAIPDQLFWGYIETPAEQAAQQANALLADLKSLSTSVSLSAGYYSYFTVSGSGAIFFNPALLPGTNHVVFVRKMNTSPADIRKTLQTYRSASQPLVVKCFSTSGAL